MSADAGGAFENVNSVSFSPDGTKVASGSWDNTVIIWTDVEMEKKQGEERVKKHCFYHCAVQIQRKRQRRKT